MNFSVLMSVYKNDRPEWFKQAIDSLLNQTLPSDDIVIVADGPLTPQLDVVLHQYENEKSISLIRLRKNMGLGNALNVGIKQAKNELIARMDSDDIAVLNRFELQIAEFNKNPELDILGGQIAEFIDNPDEIIAYRKVPITHLEIKEFARRRSPFNHPTVMYKKSTIQKLGCYDISAIRIEDYDLWLRALSGGAVCANLDVVLLKYRSTIDAMKRRKTLTSLKNHIKARSRFYARGHISLADLLYGVTTQTALCILPTRLANIAFKRAARE
jgi:glycosyltransferase involved in cell wall biosynthesis